MQTILLQLEFPYLREVKRIENMFGIDRSRETVSFKQYSIFIHETEGISKEIDGVIGKELIGILNTLDPDEFVRDSFLSAMPRLMPFKYEYEKTFDIRHKIHAESISFGEIVHVGDVAYQIRVQIKLT